MNNIIVSESALAPKEINCTGEGNKIFVEDGAVLNGFVITVRGNNNYIRIGKKCSLKGRIFLNGHHSLVSIDDETTAVDVRITAGGRKKIIIGKDCMFSRKIEVRCWDEHPIFDIASKEQINFGKDVLIGDHVWVGVGVTINKGAEIPDGCVIGSNSIVTKKLSVKNSIYVGAPAKIYKEGIIWGRKAHLTPWNHLNEDDELVF